MTPHITFHIIIIIAVLIPIVKTFTEYTGYIGGVRIKGTKRFQQALIAAFIDTPWRSLVLLIFIELFIEHFI